MSFLFQVFTVTGEEQRDSVARISLAFIRPRIPDLAEVFPQIQCFILYIYILSNDV